MLFYPDALIHASYVGEVSTTKLYWDLLISCSPVRTECRREFYPEQVRNLLLCTPRTCHPCGFATPAEQQAVSQVLGFV